MRTMNFSGTGLHTGKFRLIMGVGQFRDRRGARQGGFRMNGAAVAGRGLWSYLGSWCLSAFACGWVFWN